MHVASSHGTSGSGVWVTPNVAARCIRKAQRIVLRPCKHTEFEPPGKCFREGGRALEPDQSLTDCIRKGQFAGPDPRHGKQIGAHQQVHFVARIL